jgi:hypothetical protein
MAMPLYRRFASLFPGPDAVYRLPNGARDVILRR